MIKETMLSGQNPDENVNLTTFDHQLNYAKAFLGNVAAHIQPHIGHATEKLRSFITNPRPIGAIALCTIAAAGSIDRDSFGNESSGNATDNKGIRFYETNTSSGILNILEKGTKNCLKPNIRVVPYRNHLNPSGKRKNKFVIGHLKYYKNNTQEIRATFRKGYTYCFADVTAINGMTYVVPKNKIKLKGNKLIYKDPFLRGDNLGRDISNIGIYARRIKKQK